ncbi:tryptophan synthase subunit alpha [Candidatus Bathyarchaeota archaeon]|nr:tryptophan synthase subunit alpha [Candidatus Bathyarchaeota archaeon]
MIKEKFIRLKEKREGALIAYITGGDPSLKLTPLIADALINGGVDILEVGIPFSDPIADGSTIQLAVARALNAGATPKNVFELIKKIKKKHDDTPIAILTYYNIIYKMGLKTFFKLANLSGVDGVITADLPIEESEEYMQEAKKHHIDTVFLAAPSTSSERLKTIAKFSSGFLYLISTYGVTGVREKIQDLTFKFIKKALTAANGETPLAVGFGISKPKHVKEVLSLGVDGVIVGSKFVKIIEENKGEKLLSKIESCAFNLKRASKKDE